MIKTDIQIELVPIEELIHPDYNPRYMPSDEMQRLVDELKEFGMVENIVVNKRNMNIVGGNQRKLALELAGEDKAPVYFVDLNDNEEKRLNLALNKIGGQWDNIKLKELLETLEGDFTNTGFTNEEMDELMNVAGITDLVAPEMENLQSIIDFKFGDIRGEVPKEIYENFVTEINRMKKYLYPKDDIKNVSIVTPLEYLLANSANTPLPK